MMKQQLGRRNYSKCAIVQHKRGEKTVRQWYGDDEDEDEEDDWEDDDEEGGDGDGDFDE